MSLRLPLTRFLCRVPVFRPFCSGVRLAAQESGSSENGKSGSETSNGSPQLAELNARLANAQARTEELKTRLAGVQEDAAQAKKRHSINLDAATKYAVTPIAKDFVAIYENIIRAHDSYPKDLKLEDSELTESLNKVVSSLATARKSCEVTLAAYGIKPMDPLNEVFDPTKHEAMFTVPCPEGHSENSGKVAHVMQKGFVIHDRVIRAARVGVYA